MPETPDRERIRALVHRYFDLHSRREWAGLADMFAPDPRLSAKHRAGCRRPLLHRVHTCAVFAVLRVRAERDRGGKSGGRGVDLRGHASRRETGDAYGHYGARVRRRTHQDHQDLYRSDATGESGAMNCPLRGAKQY
ncbi:MAG: nuclear transport factor 2 family protein [Betaproteobacteria bacterium]|nr:nuclear transport factor 2 family protein [Betaproteobacteria bacterium]